MGETELPKQLEENLSDLEKMFGDSSDFYTKRMQLAGIDCAAVLFAGISSQEKMWIMALDAMSHIPGNIHTGEQLGTFLLQDSRIPSESPPIRTKTELIQKLCGGMSVLLIDGFSGGIAFSTQDMPQRSVSKPDSEGDIRGSQEGFTELLRSNIAMLRRQFRSGTLTAEIMTANSLAQTEYAVCYDRTLAPRASVERIKKRLAEIEIPVLLDSSYFASFLKKDKWNLFPIASYTERTATACARLCEGKILILVAGSPSVMILPGFFSENFECLDDYSSSAVFSGLIRILKYFAFLLAVFGPGLYVLAISFLPEMIPIALLAKLAQSEKDTPLPLMLEMLMVTLLLEIVREAGLRTPKSIGHTVSLVGALIIGDAAVSSGLVSVPVLTVAAAATVATLAVQPLYEQIILFRFAIIFATGLFGLSGFVCTTGLLLAMSCGTTVLGFDYLYPLLPLGKAAFKDGFVRDIWSALARKGYQISKREK
jgi:spore germination protein KA